MLKWRRDWSTLKKFPVTCLANARQGDAQRGQGSAVQKMGQAVTITNEIKGDRPIYTTIITW